jgi:Transglutaminase-like superfamily
MGTTVVKRNASNIDLQRAIEAAIPTAVAQMKQRANEFKGKTEAETCKKIFDYLKNQITYKADGADQQVRVPSGLIRTRQGDCKSYSVFTSAVLTNLGIPHKLVYASYDPQDSTPTHIYVVTNNGCIIDAVYGNFNAEKKASNKKYKDMNISYISGVKSRRRIGSMGKYGTGGACGIGGVDTGRTWAEKLGIWKDLPGALKIKFTASLINPVAIIGREIFKALLRKNAGGISNSLAKIYNIARADNSTAEFKKYREIELKFLEFGGNPDEMRVAFQEGNTKTPTGAYFNKLMKMKAGGYNPNIAQWIAAGVSVLFGKKYNESTGKITGNDLGIGIEPASDTAGLLASAPVWAQLTGYIVGTIGTAYVVAVVNNAPGEDSTGTDTGSGTPPVVEEKKSFLLPVLLVGGAAAAYFIFKPKKK